MKKITLEQIRAWGPCYDPSKWLPPGVTEWQGTALDVLQHPSIPDVDKLWCVLRSECLDDRTLRLFAVWCARESLALVKQTDPRSISACDVAERYADGHATVEELKKACTAAAAAAKASARAAQVTHLIKMLNRKDVA